MELLVNHCELHCIPKESRSSKPIFPTSMGVNSKETGQKFKFRWIDEMGRSKGTVISVKVPIRWNSMTDGQRTRLSRITGRDTRVIKAFLGVIERNEPSLLAGRRMTQISASVLDELTLTATKGTASRDQVQHDFKTRFPNISVNEFQECRDTAIAMWQSYLELGGSKPLKGSGYSTRKIPRFAFTKCFEVTRLYSPRLGIRHWLKLRDSLFSVKEGRTIHDKLMIPLSVSSFHLNQMKRGKVKTVRIFKDSRRKWWAIFTVTLQIEAIEMSEKPPAILSIDLGIKKTACSVLLTRKGFKEVHYWKQEEKVQRMKALDDRVSSLQKKKDCLIARGENPDGVNVQLRRLSGKRARVSTELDKKLVRDLSNHISDLLQDYDLYVTIGDLKGIRNRARNGNYRGRRYRSMIHRWTFSRLSGMLEHLLVSLGLDSKRFVPIRESWTSIMCHKCGHKGTRPKQNLFVCTTCGYKANADLNGALNIGKRLIMLIPSLRDEKGLGMWLTPRDRAILKARRKKSSSDGKSSPPPGSPVSRRVSVAEHYEQTTLEEFVRADDPAMAKTVEHPSALGQTGDSDSAQRTEARYQRRDYVPVKLDNAHDNVSDSSQVQAGDSSHGNGGTQKFLAVHSTRKE